MFVFNYKRRKISISDCKTQVFTKIIRIVLSNTRWNDFKFPRTYRLELGFAKTKKKLNQWAKKFFQRTSGDSLFPFFLLVVILRFCLCSLLCTGGKIHAAFMHVERGNVNKMCKSRSLTKARKKTSTFCWRPVRLWDLFQFLTSSSKTLSGPYLAFFWRFSNLFIFNK